MHLKKLFFYVTLTVLFALMGTNVSSQILEVSLKNTGNETVYVAYGYHYTGLLSEKSTYKGWYKLDPGKKYLFVSLGVHGQASFAFAKRDGYVVYKPKNRSKADIGVDKFYVHPDKQFEYTNSKFPSSYLPIKTSFKIAQAYCYDCSEQTLEYTINVPSYTYDKTIPFNTKREENTKRDTFSRVDKIKYNRIYEQENTTWGKVNQLVFNSKGDVFLYEFRKNQLKGFKSKKERKYSYYGKYKIKGNQISFKLSSVYTKEQFYNCIGTIQNNELDLKMTIMNIGSMGVNHKFKLKKI